MHYYAIFMQSACVHVHVYTYMYMYMHTYALCGCTRHVRRYVAINVNRPSGISQAAAIAVNRTKGVKETTQHNVVCVVV